MNCRKLANHIYGSADLFPRVDTICKALEKEPLFNTGLNENDYASMSANQLRELAVKRYRRLLELGYDLREGALLHVINQLDMNLELKRGSSMGVGLSIFLYFFFLHSAFLANLLSL